MGIRDWFKPRREAPAAAPTSTDPAAPATPGASIEIASGVTAREYRHAYATPAGPLPVRSFVTTGLRALGAPELRATLPAAWEPAAVQTAIKVLGQLATLATQGRPAELGGFTVFGTGGGGPPMGFTYARGSAVAGIPDAARALCVVLLREDEAALVQRGYATRVLGCLGERERFFPYPPWWILREQPVIAPAACALSIVEQAAARVSLGDVRVTQVDGGVLVVSLPASATKGLRTLAEKQPGVRAVALVAQLAPDADGQMVHVPGSAGPVAIAADGVQPRRMGFAFALFVGSDGGEGAFRIMEDAAAVTLPNAAFDRLLAALAAGSDCALPLDHGTSLRVEFRPDTLVDPITGHAVRAEGGWNRYAPDSPRVDTGRVVVTNVVLLIPEAELAARVEVPVLAAVIREVEAVLERVAQAHPVVATTPIAVQLTLSAGRAPDVQVAFQGATPPSLLAPLHAALAAIGPVAVRGDVAFRVEAQVHPHPRGS